jgi:putative peptidoglycan lipid II flippase
MAVGTTLSRLTGLASVVALTVVLGGGGFADGYNLANTTPNIVTDIVIGGVLSATFVPVFVDHLTTRRPDEAWEAISAVVTVAITVLLVATVAFFLLTPDIIHLYTVTNHNRDVVHQRQEAIFFLRWFVPQLTCYGLIALFTALLNTRGKFAAPMFVPIANNLVVIVVLVWFHTLVPHPSLASFDAHHAALVLLAAGTTLGVVVQAGLLVPSLLRARLHIHFLWKPAHEAMRTITRLAGWTFGWVVANQVALVVILALADGVKVPGAVSAYTYAYRFFQLPYGIVAVSVMSAVTPSLAARWARGDMVAFRHRMAFGLRGILAIIIPSAVGMVLLAHPLIDLVLGHGAETAAEANSAATALAMFALGLPGFCVFLYMVRILQAMQDTRTAFRLYLVENGLNIVFGVVLVGPLGVRGLALSLSIAYSAAALLAMSVIRQRVGGLGGDELTIPVRRVLAASGVMAVTTVLAVNVSGATSGVGLLARVVLAVVVGLVTYLVTAAVLAERASRRAGGDRPGPASDDSRRAGPAEAAGPPEPAEPAEPAEPPDGPTDGQFHGRLDDQSAGVPYGRLRPVSDEPEVEEAPGDEEEPMARIRVVTDSACDLSAELAAERNVTIVPLSIRFGAEEFVDGATLTTDEFWARCAASDVLPETSAPSPGAFQEAFLAAAASGYDGVLCISLSSEVSATFQAAVTAAKGVADQIPVRTIDSRSLTMGLGLMVLDAADMASNGATLEELATRVDQLISRTKVFGILDTLEHLEKGGRIGGARALLGSLLSIKPVVSLVDGVVEEESKQRTRGRSLRYLAEKAIDSQPLRRLAVCNGAAADIDEFIGMLDGVQSEYPLVVVNLGSVVGTHTGPGTVGLCMITSA